MKPLDKTLRNKLENTVKAARDVAERAARAALDQLGVGEASPFSHLSESEKELRRKLRVHGRQLGDALNGGKIQTMDRLVEEVAYEHWHRMLFARFLAENNLLMEPDPLNPVAVTLEECEELAADEGLANGWELASRYAARMLPQIFRPDSPVFLLTLSPEHQQKLERLVGALPLEIFHSSDSLGWVYQFWQGKKKEEINASELKIGARELPAVTQLFTEPYMVSFLLDNSLGAWWAARRLSESDFQTAKSEEELRCKASIPGVPLNYLRFVQQEDGLWTPAAGCFENWPKHLGELKTLDPCCGSGHFLVAALLMLVPMRMELEGISASDALNRVLSENIHGLELDQRCVELAAFALALTAWSYPEAGGYRTLPELQLACSGLAISAKKEEWLTLASHAADMFAGDSKRDLFGSTSDATLWHTQLNAGMEALYTLFSQAPVLGSLIDPHRITGDLFRANFSQTAELLQEVLARENNTEYHEAAIVAQGLAKAATLLAGKYNWVITNVPYLARGKQCETLRLFCEQRYPEAKNDLATVFLDRCLEFCAENGTTSIVLPQNWLFLTSYILLRKKLLTTTNWQVLARLGLSAFQTPLRVAPILLVLSRAKKQELPSVYNLPFYALDSSILSDISEKSNTLKFSELLSLSQLSQLDNPDSRVLLSDLSEFNLLSNYAESSHGQGSFDNPRFTFKYWEIRGFADGWIKQQSSAKKSNLYDGCHYAFRWENGHGDLWEMMESKKLQGYTSGKWMAGTNLFGSRGVLVNQMGTMPTTLYLGSAFDENASVVTPTDEKNLLPIICFCGSSCFRDLIKEIDQELKVTCKSLVKVPFDLDRWAKIAEEQYPKGLPKPYSDDPTQWIFHGHPSGSVLWDEKKKWTAIGSIRCDFSVLQVAVARLLGYRWPAELDAAMELADEQRQWVHRCKELLPNADEDGIVCIPPVRGEASAADRLLNLLAAAYGDAWSTDTMAELMKSTDHAGKSLETWLREKFFVQHCKLFQHRPFIWHIWDGLPDGFAALVNYHKLDYKNLERLIYTYLGDWINLQKRNIENGVDGAKEKLSAAESLKKKLELILEGEAPYDIFVRWKPLAQQPFGWNPDLNDGVRLNIRPFLSVPDVSKKGAGVLRDKPNIKWDKDRGKDVESAPWYHIFNGERINDHHLNLKEKQITTI